MKPATACLKRSDYEVRRVDLASAYELARAFHYAKGGSNTATYVHGLFRRDDFMHCLGIAWWIPPTKSCAIASYRGDWRRVLSLSRLVIEPGVPTNAATFLMAAGIRDIRRDGKYACLVTYADESRGHTGAIYLAANWESCGPTKPERIYVKSDGSMVARKAGPRTRTHGEMLALGYRCLGSFRKHKFRIIFPGPV